MQSFGCYYTGQFGNHTPSPGANARFNWGTNYFGVSNPLFVDKANRDYRLREDSPVIQAPLYQFPYPDKDFAPWMKETAYITPGIHSPLIVGGGNPPARHFVLKGIDRGDGENGTYDVDNVLPANLKAGITVGAPGVNDVTGAAAIPVPGDVKSGVATGTAVGTRIDADPGKVLFGEAYGDPLAPITGTFEPDFPEPEKVVVGETTDNRPGTYLPAEEGQVLAGHEYGEGGNSRVGTCVRALLKEDVAVAVESQVVFGVAIDRQINVQVAVSDD